MHLPAGTHHPLLETLTVVWSEQQTAEVHGSTHTAYYCMRAGWLYDACWQQLIHRWQSQSSPLLYRAPFCQSSSAAEPLFSFFACECLKRQSKNMQLAEESVCFSTESSFVLHLLAHLWAPVLQLPVVGAICAHWYIVKWNTILVTAGQWQLYWSYNVSSCICVYLFVQNPADISEIFFLQSKALKKSWY